ILSGLQAHGAQPARPEASTKLVTSYASGPGLGAVGLQTRVRALPASSIAPLCGKRRAGRRRGRIEGCSAPAPRFRGWWGGATDQQKQRRGRIEGLLSRKVRVTEQTSISGGRGGLYSTWEAFVERRACREGVREGLGEMTLSQGGDRG